MAVIERRLTHVTPPSQLPAPFWVHLDHVAEVLTASQAANAIYIDFEGRSNQYPALLGILYAEGRHSPDERRLVLRHDIVEKSLHGLRGSLEIAWPGQFHRYDTSATTVGRAIVSVVRRAKAQDRLIVAWSRHDLDVALDYGNLGAWARRELTARYRDGKETARRWLEATHPEVTLTKDAFGGTHKLARYLELTGFIVPPEHGPGLVADNLKRVATGLAKRGTYERLTAGQQDAWSDVLFHNLYDCFGLRHVVRLAAIELAAADRGLEIPA